MQLMPFLTNRGTQLIMFVTTRDATDNNSVLTAGRNCTLEAVTLGRY